MIVRDSVHGDIFFNENEQRVIDCQEVQRLRGVKQLGTAYLVYPGATHTRFNHALGTSFVAKKIIKFLRINGFEIEPEAEELISIGALVHDISHVPYGHTFEDERKIFERHDKKENIKAILSRGEIGDLLNELGIADQILKIVTQKDPTIKGKEEPWKGQIITDTICADLLDYLRRDCYYTGINKDYDDRIFSNFIVEDNKLALNFVKSGMLHYGARSEVLHLLRVRYFLTERVYYHHAKLASGAMISKALELAIKSNLLEREDLYRLDDWTLFYFLKGFPEPRPKDSPIRKLAEKVEKRDLLKRAYVLTSSTLSSRRSREEFINKFNPPTPERDQVEEMIIDRLSKGVKDNSLGIGDVIIHCLSSSALKEAEVLIKGPEGRLTQLNKRPHPSADIKAIEDAYEDLWKMYIFAPQKYIKEAGKICEQTFGRDNEYSPKTRR